MTLAIAWPRVAPPAAEASLLVGLSGGLDSTALLHRLACGEASVRRLRALHVHHGLQADADAWADHCADLCTRLGVAFETVRVAVPRDSGEGLEAAARRARHAAFERALEPGGILVLAHHRDDQAETFLLRALRASGVDGLAAMRPWRRFGQGWLWRPLLETPRETLHDYARTRQLRWIEDPSNADEVHDRNFLRRQVLPLLQARWPEAGAAFARASQLQADAAGLLDAGDAEALASARVVDPACLHVAALTAWPAARRARVLRRWIEALGLPPLPAEGVLHIERCLLVDHPGEQARFAWRDAVVQRWRGLLWAGPAPPAPPSADVRMHWDGVRPLSWPGGGELRLVADPSAPEPAAALCADSPPFVVHARSGGERIVLPGRRHSHTLKHVLQDLGIPPWQRAGLPLLSSHDGELLAAGNLAISARLQAWLRAGGWRLVWTPPA